MYLFSRTMRLGGGNSGQALEWATSMAEIAGRTGETEVQLWAQVYSPAFGTIGFTAWFADLAGLEAAGDRMNASDEYRAHADEGAQLVAPGGGPDDRLFQPVHGEPDPSREVTYVSAVRAVCASGNAARGVGVGVELALQAEKITGLPTLFGTELTGAYGTVGWLTGYESVAELESAQQALQSDPSWVAMIDDQAGGCYVEDPTITTQLVYRRLA